MHVGHLIIRGLIRSLIFQSDKNLNLKFNLTIMKNLTKLRKVKGHKKTECRPGISSLGVRV